MKHARALMRIQCFAALVLAPTLLATGIFAQDSEGLTVKIATVISSKAGSAIYLPSKAIYLDPPAPASGS